MSDNPVKTPFSFLWISHPICRAESFFVRCSSSGDRDGYTKVAIYIPLIGKLSNFPLPVCLIFYSLISIFTCLIVPHLFFCPYPLTPSSSRISFVLPIILPPCHISATTVLITTYIHHLICWHPYLLSLSSFIPSSTVRVNLIIPFLSHLPPSPSSCISDSAILVIILLCYVPSVSASVIPYLCCCHIHSTASLFMIKSSISISITLLIHCNGHRVNLPLSYPPSCFYSAAVFFFPFILCLCINSPSSPPLISLLSQLFDDIFIIPHLLRHNFHPQSPTHISYNIIIVPHLIHSYHHPLSYYNISSTNAVIFHLWCCRCFQFT